MKKSIPLYIYLSYAGALPFIIAAILQLLNIYSLPVLGSISPLIKIYALIIVSFMAGTHWGLYIASAKANTINLLVTSNILAIGLWVSYFALNQSLFFKALLIFFSILLLIDYRLRKERLIGKEYFKMRFFVTMIVLAALIVIILKK